MNWLDPTDPILCESLYNIKHETGYVLEVIGSAYSRHMKFKSLLGCPNGTLQDASSWLKCTYPHASRFHSPQIESSYNVDLWLIKQATIHSTQQTLNFG